MTKPKENLRVEIEKEEFLKMAPELQNITIYNSIISLEKKIDVLFDCTEKRKFHNSGFALAGGVVGGFIAMVAKWIFGS